MHYVDWRDDPIDYEQRELIKKMKSVGCPQKTICCYGEAYDYITKYTELYEKLSKEISFADCDTEKGDFIATVFLGSCSEPIQVADNVYQMRVAMRSTEFSNKLEIGIIEFTERPEIPIRKMKPKTFSSLRVLANNINSSDWKHWIVKDFERPMKISQKKTDFLLNMKKLLSETPPLTEIVEMRDL